VLHGYAVLALLERTPLNDLHVSGCGRAVSDAASARRDTVIAYACNTQAVHHKGIRTVLSA